MARIAFADESGTHGNTKCYAIGAVSFDERHLERFNEVFRQAKATHGFNEEAKWESINKGYGMINFGLDFLHKILRSKTARFDVIVVNARLYEKWSKPGADQESAFYLTYTMLLHHMAKATGEEAKVFIDDRSDKYLKHPEVVEKIANNMLTRLNSLGRLKDVTKVSSKKVVGIQVADMLTGALCAGHTLYLDAKVPMNTGKRVTLERMAPILGWDAMHYDTLPHDKFNVWQFPPEYRADPATREIVVGKPRFVTREELEARRAL